MLSWDNGRFHCPHDNHGGNGRFFTSAEAAGDYELKESDVTQIYEDAARSIVAGKTDMDNAASQIAKATKRSTAQVRETLATIVDVVNQEAAEKAEKESTVAKAKASTKAAPKTAKTPATKLEHIEPARFAALRDEVFAVLPQSKRNSAMAAALAAAGQGSTLSRVTELTHSKGATIKTFANAEKALRAYKIPKQAPEPIKAAKAAKSARVPIQRKGKAVQAVQAAPAPATEPDPEDVEAGSEDVASAE